MIGNPNQADFKNMVHSGMLDCNYNIKDCENANLIFGKNLPNVIGGTVRKKPKRVDPEYMDIPMEIIEKNRLVTLNVGIMFVNKIAFLITHSRGISLIMAEHLPSRTAKHIAKHLLRVVNVYHHGGYKN